MGLEILAPTGSDQDMVVAVAASILTRADVARADRARERVMLYRDDYAPILERHICAIFDEPKVRQKLLPFVPLVGGASFVKRVSDELARPLYAQPPQRRVLLPADMDLEECDDPRPSPAQESWNALAEEMQLNERQDTVARLLTGSNIVFEMVRYVDGVGMLIDIITPDAVRVISHPLVPWMPLGIAYAIGHNARGEATRWVVWDDLRYFEIGDDSRLRSPIAMHPFGLIPIVVVRRRAPIAGFWDVTTGEDLVSGAKFSMLMDLIVARKLKAQSHIQLAYAGEVGGLVKDQVSDEESILVVEGAKGQIYPINLESDPTAITLTKEKNEAIVGANYGLSRARLNRESTNASDDEGFKERVAELAQPMLRAEQAIFRIVKSLCRAHPKHRIPDDAKLVVDMGSVHNRTDRETLLRIRREEIRQGGKSPIDFLLEDNAEFGGNRRLAMRMIREKARETAEVWEVLKAVNASGGGPDAENPGGTAQEHGATGPKVRDGKMTKDEAAMLGKGKRDGKDMRAIAMRLLKGGAGA